MKMDPDEAVKRIRECINDALSIVEKEEVSYEGGIKLARLLGMVVDHWQGLDDWMMRGGFLPKDWAKNRK